VTWDASVCTEIRQQITDMEVGGGIVRCYQVAKFPWQTCINGRTHTEKVDIVLAPTFKINIVPELYFLKQGCSVVKDGSVARVTQDHGIFLKQGWGPITTRGSSSHNHHLLRT
jgi:hypothetical protein